MNSEATHYKSIILVTIILMDLLIGMEFDLFVPSFPQLQNHFSLSPFWVEALLSINFIGYCLSLFFVGRLGDCYRRKPVILLGLLIFVIGSMLCLGSISYKFLLVGRFLQGIGIAAPTVLSFLIIADFYPLKQQQFLFAILNGIMNISVAIAPVIGSYITLYFHWQGNFVALLILGLITLIMTMLFIPSYPLPQKKEVSLSQGYLSILRSKPLLLLIVNILLIFVPYWIFVGMSPLLYIKELGVSLSHFGYYQGILALVFALGSLSYGFFIRNYRYDPKKMLHVSIQILMMSLISIGLVTFLNSENPLLITVAFLVFIIGQIIPTIILYPLSLNFIPEAKGRASAMIQGGRLIFSALGLQVAGYFYQGSFQTMGLVIISFILFAVITLFLVIKNCDLMNVLYK